MVTAIQKGSVKGSFPATAVVLETVPSLREGNVHDLHLLRGPTE